MSLARRLIQSFSFRVVFASMAVFLCAMLLIRIALYHKTLDQATEEVKTTVNEQYYAIDSGIARRGLQHGLNLIAATLHFDIESSFVIAYRDSKGRLREGNLTAWPDTASLEGEWVTFSVAVLPEETPLSIDDSRVLSSLSLPFSKTDTGVRRFLARIHTYPGGGTLLVGYDLRQLDRMRGILLDVLLESTVMSLLAALLCSGLIAYWISRRLRSFNRTFANVMSGNLEERAPTRNSKDEFDQLAGNLNAMLGWISQLVSSIRDTTNALAHDMRTPLSRHRIQLTQLLEQPGVSEAARTRISQSVAEVDRIVELYDAILSISLAESRSTVASFTEFPLLPVLTNLIELYEAIADPRHIRIALTCPETLTLHGEAQQVAQAVANLLDNAVKYAPTGSVVNVEAGTTDGAAFIAVTDRGPGIPPEEYAKVRERFYRLDKARSTPGTGLGLSLVEAVMQLHGGTLRFADAKPGLRAELRFVR